jgi:hypothetical protein
MATITSGAARHAERDAGRVETALTALRGSLDAFVSDLMRRAAAEAEYARARRFPSTPSSSMDPQ